MSGTGLSALYPWVIYTPPPSSEVGALSPFCRREDRPVSRRDPLWHAHLGAGPGSHPILAPTPRLVHDRAHFPEENAEAQKHQTSSQARSAPW